MIRVQHIVNERGTENKELVSILNEIISDSYIDTNTLLNREMNHCHDIYIGKSGEEIICFFMVSWGKTIIDGSERQTVFLGLSGIREKFRFTGNILSCYNAFIADAEKWQSINRQKLILWATTATPFSYLAAMKLFGNINPNIEGSFTDEASIIARSIKCHYYIQLENVEAKTPFTLKNVAVATRYSDAENKRIELLTKKRKFDLFNKFDIIEKNGDRLLLIMNLL